MIFARVHIAVTCAVAVALLGCGDDRLDVANSTVVAASTGARCWEVRIVSPAHSATHPIDSPVALRAEVKCSAGAIGETQFWVRPNGAHHWTKLAGYSTEQLSWDPPHPGAWNVTAVAHAVGSNARDVRASTITIRVARRGAPKARGDFLTTRMSSAKAIDLLSNDEDPDGDKLTVTGFTQGRKGRVALAGNMATYTPTPGFVGMDFFKYTVSDGRGESATAVVGVLVTEVIPVCSITITGASTAAIGPPYKLTANATCDIGVPEIRWRHRAAGGLFTTFKSFSTATTADFNTANSAQGLHQFVAHVRSQGTTRTFASNILNVTFVTTGSPCTAVALDTPSDGAVFRPAQAIALHGTATCPAGSTPEYRFRARLPGQAEWTLLGGGFGSNTSSFTPPSDGAWELSVIARAIGSQAPFEVESDTATVLVTDAPQANDDQLTVDEDTSGTVNVLANDVDPNGDPLTATITVAPDAGTATITGGVVTYTPDPDYHGTDSLTYTIDDGRGNTASAMVDITINAVNDAPAAVDDALVAIEDTSASIDVTLNDVDVDGDSLVVTAVGTAAHGTVAFSGNVVTYRPAPNYDGPDSFTYTISDGHGGTSSATVAVAVLAVNDQPVAVDDELTTPEDAEGGVFLTGNDIDPDGQPLTVIAFAQPAHGTVAIVEGFASYRPDRDFNGDDEFIYTVQDTSGATSTATVHITVLPVNDAPVAVADSASLEEDSSATIDVVANDSDVDGDVLTVTVVTQPAHGTAEIVSGHEVTYTPAPDYHGGDSFSYTIADPSGATATQTVTLTITNVNDTPVAVEDVASVEEDGAATIDVVANDSDLDGDALAIASITQPAHGSATIVDATRVQYVPAANYHGPDAFTYTIDDGRGGQATAAVTITVASVNDAPVAAGDVAIVDEDTPVTIDALANDSDVDGDGLAITEVAQPANGVAQIVDGRVSYTPAANFHGADSFSYTIGDGNGGSATAAVEVTVLPINDAPVAAADAAAVLEDASVAIDVVANDADVDGDVLAIAAVSPPAHGTVAIVDAHHVLYTPAANFHGADVFSYVVVDPSGGQATGFVAVDVIPVNDAPLASPDLASLDEDTAVTVDVVANDFDIDGDALAITSITQPAHGLALVIDGHRVQYVPAPDFHGPDALSYTISDGNGGQASAELLLQVISVNDAPVAVADAASLDEDTAVTVDVVANDSDVDGDALTIASIVQPASGSAAIVDGRVSYTPNPNFHGSDTVPYTITDGNGGQASATLALEVRSVNDAPIAVADAASLDEDTAVTVDVVANDSDVDGDTLAVVSITQPASGSAAIVDGRVSYTPNPNFHGTDALSYTISDGNGSNASAELTLTVRSVNDAPVAVAVAASTFDDTPVAITLAANDVDGDALSFAIAGSPANGTLGPVSGNRVSYTPGPGFVGPDAFSYTAFDGAASSPPQVVTIIVIKSVCGNSVREGVHEECDDGNAFAADGCESTCRLTCGSGTGADRSTVDPASGHCFAAYDGVQNSYQEAAALCAGFGGHLPTITAESEDGAASSAVHASDTPWLGGDDIAVEGTFGWTTGEAVLYTRFAEGKPDGAGNADCLHYRADGDWSDTACSGAGVVSGTLCEFDLAVATPVFATGGSAPRGIAIADVNGDGHADIAAANQSSGGVGILLGNGAGGFTLHASYPTGNGPVAVGSGDFDGDGDVDLAVVNAAASTVRILLGAPDGTFTQGASVGIAGGATSIAVGDVDQSGTLDLAIATSGAVQLLHGNGGGGFSVQGSLLVLGAIASIAIGDFDQNGLIDLALATPLAVLVVRGTGGGGFGLPLTLALSTGNRSVIAGDLDADGKLDLAVANGAATVTVFFGGAGLFEPAVTLTVGGTPQIVTAGDFDGDGGTDLAAVTSNFATLFRRTGRTFTAGASIATGGGGASFAVAASVNADPAHDLVVSNGANARIGLLLGGANGLAGGRVLVAGTGASSTATADFNKDGLSDLAVVDPAASKVNVFVQTASGGFAPSATISTLNNAGPTYAVVADFDLDGNADLAIANVNFGSVSVALGTGTGTFGATQNTGVAQSPRRLAVGDFNGDNRPDLAVPAAGGNVVTLLINTGLGRFGRAADLPVGAAPSAAVVADFNGDNRRDIAVTNSGEASVKVLLGRGDSTFLAPAAFPIASGSESLAAGDLDGDGKLDLAAAGTQAGSVSILRGTGTGGFDGAGTIATGAQPSAVVAVDLDGDGRLDLVVANAGTSDVPGDVTVLHGSSTGFVASGFPLGVAPGWLSVADLDHDGHLDINAAFGTSFVTTLFSPR
jgi:cysteine-rich repeat protein